MNTPKTEIKRWGIVVIQSLSPDDRKTGEMLFMDLLRYKELCNEESFSYFYDVNSRKEFEERIDSIHHSLKVGDILTLHIETHGCDEGIVLNDGSIVPWKNFYDMIRPINIDVGHLLFVVMAMCKSIAMISSIDIEKRAPYRAFICTTRKVTGDEIYRGFEAFYTCYFNLSNIQESMKMLQNEVKDSNGYSPFQILSAESVFDEIFDGSRSIENLVISQLKEQNISITDSTKKDMSNTIRRILQEIHGRCYDYYNFKDLY